MFDWLAEIGDMLSTIFHYFLNFITSMVQAVALLTSAVGFPVQIIGWMPMIVGTSITIVVAIAVVKLLVGWGNS